MLAAFDDKLGIGAHVSLCNFTKEPLYILERCNVVALPSTGKGQYTYDVRKILRFSDPLSPCRVHNSQNLVPFVLFLGTPFPAIHCGRHISMVSEEGLPNVLLEALAMERPCVATAKYGMPEVHGCQIAIAGFLESYVFGPSGFWTMALLCYTAKFAEVIVDGETGYTFPSGDAVALADAIVRMSGKSAEERAAMAQAGKEMVFAEHDRVKQFGNILEIIKEKTKIALIR